MSETVVVLGGGVGGLVAATRLRERLPREHRVVLVDRTGQHQFAPSFLWLMTGDREPARLSRDLRVLERRGIRVVVAEVEGIDLAQKEVRTTGETLRYDHLVVSLGAELASETVPGLAEAGETFYTLPGATRLRDKLRAFKGGRLVVLVAATPFKCPAAPYEAALLLESHLRRRRLRAKVELDVYTPEKLPMAVAGPAVGTALRGMLEARGIRFHPEHKVKTARPEDRLIVFENGAQAAYDLLAYVPPHRAPRVAREADLTNGSGWVSVDAGTLVTKHPAVHAIGDLAAVKLPSGLFLPKAGVFAHAEAEVVANNIAVEITGRGTSRRFDGHGYCWVETGEGKAAFGSGDFYAAPVAKVKLRAPTRYWHWGKLLFEKYWLWKWF
ncbi:MAG: NAD(P)/FAD-dependent oxidoreductase [Euryarchaeota archaeon]|nr:NAD(P)/FAD-dependent oxidoreductase [Euryarchaeota archaeon]